MTKEETYSEEEQAALLNALDPIPESESQPVFALVGHSKSRRRPYLKYGAYLLLLVFVIVSFEALTNENVQSKASGYMQQIRPPKLQSLGPGALPQVQPQWGIPDKPMSSSDEPNHDEMIIGSSDEPERVPGQLPKTSGASAEARPRPSRPKYSPSRHYSSCEKASWTTLGELQEVTEPTVMVISKGQTVSGGDVLPAPAPVCILVAIPQLDLPERNYTDAPVPNRGPDNIHLMLNSTDVILTFPPLTPLPGQPGASELHTNKTIIYQADTVLYTAGDYSITGEVEFSHWFWAQEWATEPGKPLDFITNTGSPNEAVGLNLAYSPRALPSASITVSGDKAIPSRPPCSDALNAGVGRWYKQSSFPSLSPNMTDEWGYSWQGDHCELTYFTPEETMDCFANKSIQFYGDSMVRRLAKAILTGGTWCSDNTTAACQDADDAPELPVVKLIEASLDDTNSLVATTSTTTSESHELTEVSFSRGSHFQHGDIRPIVFGHNSTAYFSFLTQMYSSPGLWMDRLYDSDDLTVLRDYGKIELNNTATSDREIKAGREDRARPPPESNGGHVDLVIIGFGAWDQAFTNTFDEYEASLAGFRNALVTAYAAGHNPTPIAMRLSNSWCCRGTSAFRRYTGGRVCEFDTRTRRVFDYPGEGEGEALNHKIMIVDPINMNGRPEVLQDYGASDANHPRASHVRMEMQMLMNSVCERKEDGTVQLRST